MYKDCKWLPELIKFDYPVFSEETIEMLYDIFLNELYYPIWTYKDKPVYFRHHPEYDGKQESFFHIISDKNIHGHDYNTVNEQRAQRLLWGRAILEHEPCTYDCDCQKIYVWKFSHHDRNGSRIRTKIYHSKYNYLIILEEKPDKWLYVTSYQINNSQKKRELIREYKKQRTLNHN